MTMPEMQLDPEIGDRIANGRTDLVRQAIQDILPPTVRTEDGTSLIQWCAYYGDVSAIDFLLTAGESLKSLGPNLGLAGAAFHGHWRLTEYLLENGAAVDFRDAQTGETALHTAFGAAYRKDHDLVVRVLLQHGASLNQKTIPGVETGAFMRDCRTRGETPLHRAAACGSEGIIGELILAGAECDVKDAHGDTPLGWASWHRRPDSILRALCYGDFTIDPDRVPMEESLRGKPLGGSFLGV